MKRINRSIEEPMGALGMEPVQVSSIPLPKLTVNNQRCTYALAQPSHYTFLECAYSNAFKEE